MNCTTIDKTDIHYRYFFNAHLERELYFGMKSKYGHRVTAEQLAHIKQVVCNEIGGYDWVVIPQSSNSFIREVATCLAQKVVEIKKHSCEEIVSLLEAQKFMKAEKNKLLQAIQAMEGGFKINQIAGNQRKRFINILFEQVHQPLSGKVLIFDDSIFSGYTMQALLHVVKEKVPHPEIAVMFSKQVASTGS